MSLKEYISNLFHVLERDTKENNIELKISCKDILTLYNKQGGKCIVTGIKMTYIRDDPEHRDNNRYLYNMVVDRIDHQKAYTRDNIQLVCNVITKMRGDIPMDLFIKTCKQFVRHNNVTELTPMPGDPLFSQVSPDNSWPTVPKITT